MTGSCSDIAECKRLTMMCRRAVDLSQGQLIDLTIAYFGDDNFLGYIVDATTLIEAVKKLNELEELHPILPWILAEDIEAIGNICPMLKCFTFSNHFSWLCVDSGLRALAITKTMPNLNHLALLSFDLDNEGLQAILDSCPQLQSLDLWECFSVDLDGPLGERCFKQIKHMKLPSDNSIDDYEWDAQDSDDDDDYEMYWSHYFGSIS